MVSGAGGTTGVALLEIYEVDSDNSTTARLSNISTRAQVNSGDGVLIAGMVIGGSTPHTVLVRAAGPALSPFGVSPLLAKPMLQLFAGSQPLLRNTGWGTAPNLEDLRLAMKIGGFPFPENSTDSAFLVTLNPGAYTFQVSGADGGTGVSLLEIYEIPQ